MAKGRILDLTVKLNTCYEKYSHPDRKTRTLLYEITEQEG